MGYTAFRFNENFYPGLKEGIEELCNKADLPMPLIYVLETPECNVAVIGETGSLVFSRGYLEDYRYELEDILSSAEHEIGHCVSRKAWDISLNTEKVTKAMGWAWLISASIAAVGLLSNNDNMTSKALTVAIACATTATCSRQVSLHFLRQHEYKADEVGMYLSGRPATTIQHFRDFTEHHFPDHSGFMGDLPHKHPLHYKRIEKMKQYA
ncbi:MAG: M48 family metallopeptidase [Alphaproteobacteria bacterium]